MLQFRHEESGPVHAVIRTDDAPVTFDDDLHLGYDVADRVRTCSSKAAMPVPESRFSDSSEMLPSTT